jgi:hypothetical protein
MFTTPSKISPRVLSVVIVTAVAVSSQARAALEEVTFQAPVPVVLAGPTGGPIPLSLSGYFFFDTTQVTGGLRPVFQRPAAPGEPGTASVSFGAGPSGAETIAFSDGSVLTVPLTGGFSLGADYQAPVCGNFDDCFYRVGQVLTLSQFNAAADPWALVFNGMRGGFGEFFPATSVGDWLLNGGGQFEVRSVPEPAVLVLLLLGFVALGLPRLCRVFAQATQT